MYSFGCITQSALSRTRQWTPALTCVAHSSQLSNNDENDDSEDEETSEESHTYSGDHFLVFGHVDNQHFVFLNISENEPPTNNLNQVNPFIRPVNRFINEDEDLEDVPEEIRTVLLANKNDDPSLFTFSKSQQNFNAALKHLIEEHPNSHKPKIRTKKKHFYKLELELEILQEKMRDEEEEVDDSTLAKGEKLRTKVNRQRQELTALEQANEAFGINMQYEAALHTKNAVTHLKFHGKKKWEAVLDLTKTNIRGKDKDKIISIEVKEAWVQDNFHPDYVEYIKNKNEMFGTLHDDEVVPYENLEQGKYRVQVSSFEFH